MEELGSFSFKVDADLTPAQRKLQQFVGQVQQSANQVSQALSGLQAQPILLKADGTPFAKVTQEVNKTTEAVGRLARTAKAVADRPVALTVRANLSEAEEGIERLTSAARQLGQARFNLAVRADGTRQAEQAITRLQAALRAARSGETINVNVQASSVTQADAAIRRLTADINAAKAAGARVAVNVQTNQAARGFLGEAGRGFLQQATPGLATGAAAAVGVVAAQAVLGLARAFTEATAAGVRYNAMLETSAVQFRVFLGSAQLAEDALQRLRRNADITPFDTEEVIRSGAVFAQVTGGSIQRMERLVELAEQLAAVNPNPQTGGGLEGATVALREALAGDFTSIRERFNVSASTIQRLREAGLAGEDLAVALVKAAGGSRALVEALSNTFEGRLSTATSNLNALRAEATKPLFEGLSAGLAAFNAAIDANRESVKRWAAEIGQIASAGLFGLLLGGPGLAGAAAGGAAVGRAAGVIPAPRATTPPTGLSAADREQQPVIDKQIQAVNRANGELLKQEQQLQKNKDELERIQTVARQIEKAYADQLRPLEKQQAELNKEQRALDTEFRRIADARDEAGPDTATRAAAAAATVLLDHEQALLEVRHRRAELAEEIARREFDAANRVAEAQIRAAERALEALQRRAQAERDARQEALEGLREEIRARQEARAAALEALREIIQARQEERREALDALREQIDERRRLYDEERENRDEVRRAAQEAFAEQERLSERAHERSQDRYRDQIDALRAQAAAVEDRVRRESEAQRELAAFDRAERARQRAQNVASAERNVRQARTGRERADALQRLIEIRAEAAADARREAIQERINNEREQADRRREQIQARIAELERKARDEDRAYQRDRDARRERFEAVQRAQAAADRVEERAERERRRAEDAQVRALEKADREATKREQAEIRAAEKADREQTKAENAALRAAERADRAQTKAEEAAIRAQERADREADRAAQREILDLQQKIVDARNALADKKDAFQVVLDDAGLQRLREQVALELKRLEIRQKLLDATDPKKLAQAASDEVFAQALQRILDGRKAVIQAQIDEIKERGEIAVGAIRGVLTNLEIDIRLSESRIKELQKQVQAAKDALDAIRFNPAANFPTGPGDGGVPPVDAAGNTVTNPATAAGIAAGNAFTAGFIAAVNTIPQKLTEVVVGIPKSISEALNAFFKDDDTVKDAVTTWTQEDIIAPVETLLEISSPSKKAERWASSIAEGFVVGLTAEERRIVDALEAPWIEVDQRFWPEVERKWKVAGADHAKAYVAGFEAERIQDDIEKCIDDVLRRIEQNDPNFKRAGRRAAREFAEGWCELLNLRDCFAREMEWMIDNARAYGTQVGAQFSRGFAETATPASGGGGTGGGVRWFNPYTGQVVVTSGPPPGPVPPWERAGGGTGSGSGSQPQRRALGGPAYPGQAFLVGEHGPELFIPRQAGAVIPHALSMSTLAGGGLAQISSRGAVSVSVNQTIHASPGMDPNALARVVTDQAVAAIIDVLDDAERRAPNPLSRILPGAVR